MVPLRDSTQRASTVQSINTRRRIFISLCIFILILLAIECVRIALANAIASQVYSGMRSTANMAAPDWQRLSSRMDTVLFLNRSDPDYQDVKIMLQQQSEVNYQVSDDELQQYRNLVQRRPAWPYVWINLLRAKSTRREFDEEYQRALRQALNLAPWTKKVNSSLLQNGLRDWDQLDLVTHRLVAQAVQNGLLLQPKVVQLLVEKYQRKLALCGGLEAKYRALLSCSDDVLISGQAMVRRTHV